MLVYVVLFLVRSNVCMTFDTVIVKVQISLEYVVSDKYPKYQDLCKVQPFLFDIAKTHLTRKEA